MNPYFRMDKKAICIYIIKIKVNFTLYFTIPFFDRENRNPRDQHLKKWVIFKILQVYGIKSVNRNLNSSLRRISCYFIITIIRTAK